MYLRQIVLDRWKMRMPSLASNNFSGHFYLNIIIDVNEGKIGAFSEQSFGLGEVIFTLKNT